MRLRARQKRNLLATLLLSQGVPMISRRRRDGPHAAGQQQRLLPGQRAHLDRLGHADGELIEWTRRLKALRREHQVLRRQKFFVGAVGRGHRRQDLVWLRSDGQEMKYSNWRNRGLLSIGMLLNGEMIPDRS